MLHIAIEERFHFKFHREAREIPGYALVIAKGDSQLHETNPGDAIAARAGTTAAMRAENARLLRIAMCSFRTPRLI